MRFTFCLGHVGDYKVDGGGSTARYTECVLENEMSFEYYDRLRIHFVEGKNASLVTKIVFTEPKAT